MKKGRYIAIYAQAAFYLLAGFNHFRKPGPYADIVPGFLGARLFIVYSSGVAEIIIGFFLLFERTRRMAATSLILLLILIFPANIQMAVDYVRHGNPYAWLTLLRLPLQFVLILLAWWSSLKGSRIYS